MKEAKSSNKAYSRSTGQTGPIAGAPGTAAALGITEQTAAQPKPALKMTDAIAVIVGIVVGAGIFRTPSLVAANVADGVMFLLVWVFGGLISLIGALCYAELATSFPHAGGDYHFLTRAFGKKFAFLFAWARMSVIQTGSIAVLAFIVGDYLSEIYRLGSFSAALYAGVVVVVLTGINIIGLKLGTATQKLLIILEALGILIVLIAGFFFAGQAETSAAITTTTDQQNLLGLAMVFVLLTFGGWNEAAYISAELRSGPRGMAKALILSIVIITIIYLLVNMAFLKALGMEGMAESSAVGGDLMRLSFGQGGVWLIGIIVSVAALTSANATIFTGARTNYALGRDFRIFKGLGIWNESASAPVNALLTQGGIALGLILLGIITRKGFETIVEYTAPVFWFFLLMVGVSVFVLRKKEPDRQRPFRVPFYPLTPLLFCLTSAYLLYSSLVYTGLGALVGIGVLAVGVLLLIALPWIEARLHAHDKEKRPEQPSIKMNGQNQNK